jgi:hypothetical protein
MKIINVPMKIEIIFEGRLKIVFSDLSKSVF